MASQASFALLCEFGGHTLRIELPVTSSDDQIKLLRNVSDAYCDFLEELKPEDEALADMVEKGIAGMAQLKDKVEVDQRQREADVKTESKAITKAEPVMKSIIKEAKRESQCSKKSLGEARVSPKRHVTFKLEKEVDQESESCEVSEEEDLPLLKKSERLWPGEVQNIAERDSIVQRLLEFARDAIDADEQDQSQVQEFHSVVPSMRERATHWPSQLRSAMKASRLPNLRSSHATRRVCPEGAEFQTARAMSSGGAAGSATP
eukprot:TRINITY_DN12737_c0_g4_i1.p1 TRINITY_DN12737_c0_g4~~TRINITY_DN12737_c0_g4_i1.p1  ORF type:complete len:262 (-),score=64.10 TRINITY_DN12737_c0_g4_i1:12-797(-)